MTLLLKMPEKFWAHWGTQEYILVVLVIIGIVYIGSKLVNKK